MSEYRIPLGKRQTVGNNVYTHRPWSMSEVHLTINFRSNSGLVTTQANSAGFRTIGSSLDNLCAVWFTVLSLHV